MSGLTGTLTQTAVVVVASLCLLVVLLGGVILFLRHLRRSVAEDAARSGGPALLVDDKAQSFGVTSRGKTQARGNGYLALTEGAVQFVQWIPRRELLIPRDRILQVATTKSHLGKWSPWPILLIRFTNDAGAEDSIALRVTDLSAWLEKLGTN